MRYIVSRSTDLKNRFTNEVKAPVEFGCIFCQDGDEYTFYTNLVKVLGNALEDTVSGYTYLLNKPIGTVSGPLRLVKIRKPSSDRLGKGDADFNTDYEAFKKKYQNNPRFELVKYDTFEMLRLSDIHFDVMTCFSNIPKSKNLGIKL